MTNNNLHEAKRAKNDEFYTQLSDIENELRYYRNHFNGKVVYCNCDDAFESNFFKYFVLNFNKLGLKKLITTCYSESSTFDNNNVFKSITNNSLSHKAYKAEIVTVYDKTGNGKIDMDDIIELFKSGENHLSELEGDGDFRSEECVELLKESDIVVTNPPFSLFREYGAQLIEYDKKFLIIGNMNAITYKEVFPLIKENKLWLGMKPLGSEMYFDVPKEHQDYLVKNKKEGSAYKIIDGEVRGRMAAACWFTNLDHRKRHEELILVRKYSEDEYPKYDNYNAINVNKVCDIPCDYNGVMGVPITFLDKYNPEQFQIIGQMVNTKVDNFNFGYPFINGVRKYARIIIKVI